MDRSLRRLLRAVAALPAAAAAPRLRAQGRTVRLLVGFPPGGGTDAIARVLAEKLKDELTASVVVDNRAGAGGQIAAQELKRAVPDGNTLFLSHDHTISILPLVLRNAGFEPARDFVPVAGFATFVNAFAVSGGTAARSFNDYVAWVKAQGGKSAVGIPAPASVPQFLVQVIGATWKLDLAAAPYRGSAPMMGDMIGNQIPAGVGSVPDFIENHKAGRLRVVAVLGGQRQIALPEVPTFSELGLRGFEDVPYYGLFAPAGTPRATVEATAASVARVIALPEVRGRLTAMGLTVQFMSPAQLAQRERAYAGIWAEIIRKSGFQPQ
ncbi:MAG: Bug family tripartite tricarboxylate transporter substrate binding protein [Burkholderiales bacterium]|nr:Bug family tripartite tricarboxylate transporter substrate binding protein [Burkholderiales bacterium]